MAGELTAHRSPTAASSDGVIERVTRMERQWLDHLRRGEHDRLARMLPEDYTFITSEGNLMSKQDGIRRLREIDFQRIEVGETVARRYGEVAVLVTNLRLKAHLNGEDVSGNYCHTRVYAQCEGDWVPVSGQSTRSGKAAPRKKRSA